MTKMRFAIVFVLIMLALAGGAYSYHAWEQRRSEQQVFQLVLSKGLKEDSTGTVQLPAAYKSLSVDGKAYVVRHKDLTLVYLPQKIGGHGDSNGTLLTSRPLVKTDLADDGFGHPSVLIIVPDSERSPSISPGPIRCQAAIRQPLGKGEYEVGYNND